MDNLLLDNIIFSLQQAGGVSAVWANLLDAIQNHRLEFECIEYGIPKNIYRTNLLIPYDKIILLSTKRLQLRRYLSPSIEIDSPTIFHSSYYRTIDSALVKNVTTVHDFTYEYFTHGPKAWIHKWQKFNAIRNADKIVCISHNTKNDLLKFLPGISPDKISVIYNGVSDSYQKLYAPPYTEYSDCLIFVGARGGYKNFKYAIEVAKNTKHRLLICGSPLKADEKKELIANLGEDGFIEFNRPTNEQLNRLYNSVFALIYPSSYEGFGIPVLEAQKAGCPVIALNTSSIPEVIGEYYPMLDNLTVNDAAKIIELFKKPAYREDFISFGLDNSKRFSWEEMGNQYIELYKSL